MSAVDDAKRVAAARNKALAAKDSGMRWRVTCDGALRLGSVTKRQRSLDMGEG